jgi:tRNA U34 5-carboxymethylaminomethyl modifying GTPase MnmE/TrmE
LFVVSTALANEDYDSIQDLVNANVVQNLKIAIKNLNKEQKKLIAIRDEDLILGFVYDVQITYEDNGNKFNFLISFSHVYNFIFQQNQNL